MTGWLKPIGFDVDEPEYEYHGESAHPDAIDHQCMCGHPDYVFCEVERDLGLPPGSYIPSPSSGMSHVATTGEGKSPTTLRSGEACGAGETRQGADANPPDHRSPAAPDRNTK